MLVPHAAPNHQLDTWLSLLYNFYSHLNPPIAMLIPLYIHMYVSEHLLVRTRCRMHFIGRHRKAAEGAHRPDGWRTRTPWTLAGRFRWQPKDQVEAAWAPTRQASAYPTL